METFKTGSALRNFLFFAAVPVLAMAAFVLRFPVHAAQLAATYRQGKLSVTIPYDSPQGGSGKLTVEVLDPEDHSLGRTERRVEVRRGTGVWEETISFPQPPAFEEILWQRLSYRFEFDDPSIARNEGPIIEGIESISQIISRPVLRILGDNEYLAGSQAAIRVLVSAANSDAPQSGSVHIDLLVPDQSPLRLFSGSLDRRGAIEANFRFPAGRTGDCQLHFVADTPIGSTEYTLAHPASGQVPPSCSPRKSPSISPARPSTSALWRWTGRRPRSSRPQAHL
jgi:hypothetical protein